MFSLWNSIPAIQSLPIPMDGGGGRVSMFIEMPLDLLWKKPVNPQNTCTLCPVNSILLTLFNIAVMVGGVCFGAWFLTFEAACSSDL